MAKRDSVGHFCFTDQAVYERGVREQEVIDAMRKKYNLSNGKTALKIYQKAVEEEAFSTVVGYCFLEELRGVIDKSGQARSLELPHIPVKHVQTKEKKETRDSKTKTAERYQTLYQGERFLNRRLKVIIAVLCVLVVAFLVIEVKSQYSVFTYFTDYKANMEEELINKYENWETELKAREEALENETNQKLR